MEEQNLQELQLTDLIEVETLQRIQDAFAAMTGMAALTTDLHGFPVTKGSNFTDFCTKYTRVSEVGHLRCEQCDKYGAEQTLQRGRATSYLCHAGLIDYAAPILANGRMIGSFIGGQVLTKPFEKEKVYQIAEELDIDPEKFWEAAQKVQILGQEDIDNAAQFLYTIANVLSEMAYGKYMMMQANQEIEKANSMKSDFLANMSHEIRTPMNAVIGMSEMALREDLPPSARKYVRQIKSSSKALLTIINDILDFSKIESGKMDIIPVKYDMMSVINDIANIAIERLKDKNVDLILDVSPDLPHELFGDNNRIKQILLNLVNNAIKFTSEGQVVIRVSHNPLSDTKILLRFSIEDSGIGIKEVDLEKIFNSFQQVDSKRNRNIEGTGLGLAICRRLVHLMGGTIEVSSIYGEGSIFSCEIPQKIIDAQPSCRIKEPAQIRAIGLFQSSYVRRQFEIDCQRFGIEYGIAESVEEVVPDVNKENFFFVEQEKFDDQIEEYIRMIPEFTTVLLLPFELSDDYDIPQILMLKKPLYSMNEAMIFNREGLKSVDEEDYIIDFSFIAPEAKVLIVDDNAINLTVAEGLLEPVQMKIDTALSGKEAIDMISVQHYDIVFMDHMMPELDGVETTHIIRRLHPEYNDVPIIALSANVVNGVKEMFLEEGMNDFVAKPIELKALLSKVVKWLPVEKVQKISEMAGGGHPADTEEDIVVGDLDTKAAIKLVGNARLFWMVLKDYYRVISKKAELIKETEINEDWAAYTIEVHALKSASKQIGAMSLSEKAARLESAGNARDSKLIHEYTDEMLAEYKAYLPVLAPFCEEEEEKESRGAITKELLAGFFADMREGLENLDMTLMESVSDSMRHYSYDDVQKALFERLQEAVENIDVDICEEIIAEWESII